jgi:nicotinamide mononucleotide transporter
MLLQLIFICQGFYGWYNWFHKNTVEHELEISYLKNSQRVFYVLIILFVSAIWATLLASYTNASTPYVDAFVSTTSLVANWLMAKKKTDHWILWIVADTIYVALFWYKELYLSSALYVVFLIMATIGLIEWNKKCHTKKALS